MLLCSSCSKINFRNISIEEAFKLARVANKKVYIQVGADGCNKCSQTIKELNKNSIAKKILNNNYICLNVNKESLNGNEFSQITGCTFFPYSCFFDYNGNLITLRVGDNTINFKNISSYEINEFVFKELFNITISYQQYKKRVSLCFQSFLKRKQKISRQEELKETFGLICKSININPTPYNLYQGIQLANQLKDTISENKFKIKFENIYYPDNEYLYSNLREKLNIDISSIIFKQRENNSFTVSKQNN